MKNNPSIATAAALLAMCAVATQVNATPPGNIPPGLAKKGDPVIPVGTVSAYPTIVQAGTYPTLTWGIDYPSVIDDIIVIDDGTITPKEDMDLEVRVLGASYQISKHKWGYVQAELKANGASSWTRFFYDTQNHVDPTEVLYTAKVKKSLPINFRARCNTGRYWKPYRQTGTGTINVVALVNGDTPPTTTPAFQQDRIESFLRPYLDDSGNIKIGPKDVIFLIELGQTNPAYSGFDLQDLVLLATFKTKSNNGHGNNIDGVDMSNPGNAPFMANDTDPTVDDEGSGGGAYPSLN